MLEGCSTIWSIVRIFTSVEIAIGIVASFLVVVFLGLTVRAKFTRVSFGSIHAIRYLLSHLSFGSQRVSTIFILAACGISGLFHSFLVQLD